MVLTIGEMGLYPPTVCRGYADIPLPAQPKLRDDRLRRHPPPVLGQSPPQSLDGRSRQSKADIKGQMTSIARSGGLLFSFRSCHFGKER